MIYIIEAGKHELGPLLSRDTSPSRRTLFQFPACIFCDGQVFKLFSIIGLLNNFDLIYWTQKRTSHMNLQDKRREAVNPGPIL